MLSRGVWWLRILRYLLDEPDRLVVLVAVIVLLLMSSGVIQ